MTGQIIYQVDSFTTQVFSGNPAGVCLLNAPRPDDWMQKMAREMNLSETAFLVPEGQGFRLRWFTPKKEVSLCGHATLASAHILWEQGVLGKNEIARFETLSGTLTATKSGNWIALDFPAREIREVEPPQGLLEALGVSETNYVGKYREDYLVEVPSAEIVRKLAPDFSALLRVETRGTVVTARSDKSEYDFISRFFAPVVGINEDPVTGSAHCALTPYWSNKLGKPVMNAYQASERGGELRVSAKGERVIIEGQAVTVFTAKMKM